MTRSPMFHFTFAFLTESGEITQVAVDANSKSGAVNKAYSLFPEARKTDDWLCLEDSEGEARHELAKWLSTPRRENGVYLTRNEINRLRGCLLNAAADQGLSVAQLRKLNSIFTGLYV